nr:hypothetical protein GPVRGNEL_GPVRGNEL_CDS_0038 [Caudoviricetes sp.]
MLRKRNAIRQDISNAPIIGCIKKHFQQSKRKNKMDKELKISAENALAVYNNTDAKGRELLEHLFAYARLVIIAEALNKGWKPKFDGDENRYYPYFLNTAVCNS